MRGDAIRPWLSQVKNFFVFKSGPGKHGQVLSLWEVVRRLEQRFPGQSEYIRIDLMLLMVLNGNDYLPKVKGTVGVHDPWTSPLPDCRLLLFDRLPVADARRPSHDARCRI